MLLADFSLMPEQASTMAPRVDGLLLFVASVTAFFTILIASLIIYFAIRYRRRAVNLNPPEVKENPGLEIAWSVIPLILCLIMFAWGANIYFAGARPPDNALEVYV